MERGVLRLCLRAYRIRTYVRIRVRGKKAEAERERDRWKDIATWKCNAGRANALDPKKLGSISDG